MVIVFDVASSFIGGFLLVSLTFKSVIFMPISLPHFRPCDLNLVSIKRKATLHFLRKVFPDADVSANAVAANLEETKSDLRLPSQ